MKCRLSIFIVAFLFVATFFLAYELPVVFIKKTKGPIKLDGILNESAWSQATVIDNLRQREPKENTEPTEKTIIYLLYDENYLYIGAKCYDSNPKGIVAYNMLYDFHLRSDDYLEILLDPFNDRRNAYVFAVNPNGAKKDGLVVNNSERSYDEWDGIWYVATSRDERGWYVEMAIPFKTISYKPGETRWGFNIRRYIKRKMEEDRWASPFYDVYFYKVAKAGYIAGIEGIKQGKGIDVRPYALAGLERPEEAATTDFKYKGGLDVFYNITPGLKLSLTYNTDFAETEVDPRRINLTRFPLFFPEKRRFFLEGSDIFKFTGQRPDVFIPFYSRRIGLLEGEQIPILGGVKLTGRYGNYNIGILDIHTRDYEDVPGRNFFVARVTRNLFEESVVGLIYTYGNPASDYRNYLYGFDFQYGTTSLFKNKNFFVMGYYLRSYSEEKGWDDLFGFKIDYPNDLIDTALVFTQIGENFNPALGFVRRTGIRRYTWFFQYKPRPEWKLVRQFFFEFGVFYTTDLHGRKLEWRIFTAPINLRTESGEHIEFNYMPQYDYLDYPFEIHEGIVIPPGEYTMDRFRFELNTSQKRPFVVDISIRFGEFYTGHATTAELGLTLKPSKHFFFQILQERNYVNLREGSFTANVTQIRVNFYLSPYLTLQNYIQYDNLSRSWGINARLRWIIKEGNEIFIIYNEGWSDVLDRWSSLYRKAQFKVQYTFRF